MTAGSSEGSPDQGKSETDVDVELLVESPPDSRGELWASVRNCILGKAIEAEDLFQQSFSDLKSSRQFG